MIFDVVIQLWLPILVSAVGIFIVSSLLWAVLPWHHNDCKQLADEDAVQAAIGVDTKPGFYALPFAPTSKDMENPEVKARIERGPLAFITIMPDDVFNMGKKFFAWFLYSIFIAMICAFMVKVSLIGVDAADPRVTSIVIHFTFIITFLAYGGAYLVDAIWFSRPMAVVGKYLVDAAIYGVITSLAFVYLM